MSRMGVRDRGQPEDDERRQGTKKSISNHRKTGDDAAARSNPISASGGFPVAFRLRLTRPRAMWSDRPPRIAHPSGQTPAVVARERGIKLITLRAAFFSGDGQRQNSVPTMERLSQCASSAAVARLVRKRLAPWLRSERGNPDFCGDAHHATTQGLQWPVCLGPGTAGVR